MARERFDLIAGHLIIEKGGHRLLLDTGSPVSFGTCGEVRVFNRRIHLSPSLVLDARDIGRHIGALLDPPGALELDGLLGTDLLRGLEVTIDWEARTITTSAVRPDQAGYCGFRPSRSAIPADADRLFRQGDHRERCAAG